MFFFLPWKYLVFSKRHFPYKLKTLTIEDCSKVHKSVLELKPYWTHRDRVTPFYTLGAVSYLDARQSYAEYIKKAKQENLILAEHFGWLYEQIIEKLSEILGDPVILYKIHAVPGFHIFLGHPLFKRKLGDIHCDLQFKHLDWSDFGQPLDLSSPISFTLPISLPRSGGGINLWSYHYKEGLINSKDEIRSALNASKKTFIPYKIGYCFIHSGLQVHQIAPITNPQSVDMRITLQGHALRSKKKWLLYW